MSKDLGITISYDLSWSDHIHKVVNEANRVLGVTKRVFGSKTSVTEFSLPYKSLVRPILEYAVPVWCSLFPSQGHSFARKRKSRGESRDWLSAKRGEKWNRRDVVPF